MSVVHTAVDSEPIALDEAFFADPHALYARLREQRPVTRAVSPLGLRVWVVTRYADARAALVDPRLAKDASVLGGLIERHLTTPDHRIRFAEVLMGHMLNSDPPDHTRLRKLVNRAFTGRAVAALRPRIEAIAAELTDAMAARVRAGEHTVDLLDAFAFPLPMTVICEILGVPDEERDDFRRWSNTVLSSAAASERSAAAAAMAGYLSRLVADKRAHPGQDMLSEIVAASEDSDRLSPVEAVSMAFLLLVAGHETTVNLIGNGMLALLRHPDRFAELRANPDLTPSAVEEFLRFDGPINLATFRHTTEPVTIGGTEIPAGEIVLVSLTSANRDPAHFDRPDELDLHRDGGNLAFGYGIHHCLGASLARLEGEIAFRALLSRFPDMSLAAEPTELSWRVSTLIRGVVALPVRLSGPAE
ncbi:MAG TPA: cytochrome P450 [Pseudonocardia sp.]|jgi:cytochrome P450|nr:cytochrome P450 [Pseudonocardia sp.]